MVRRPALSPRLDGLGTTIFAEMSALANATGAINLGQGFPDEDGPIEVAEAAIDAIRSGQNQYPPGSGIEPLRQAIAEHQARFWGLSFDPGHGGARHGGSHRGHRRRPARALRSRRRDPRLRTHLRLLPGGGGDGWCPAPVRRARAAGPRGGRRGDGGARHRSHPAGAPQHAAQPHREGLQHRRAGGRRAALRRARPDRRHRRGLRAPRLRRSAPAARLLPGHGRAHPDDLVRGQDVLVHRLEDRVGVRPRGARVRGPHHQAVPHLRQRGAVPAGRGPRPRVARRLLRRAERLAPR